jgi:hypothetical protein
VTGNELVTGTPTGPLSLIGQGAHENVGVFDESTYGDPPLSKSVYGVIGGTAGTYDGYAQGAVSVLFDEDVDSFGMSLTGLDGDGQLIVNFFQREGTLLDHVVIATSALNDFQSIAFRSSGPRFAGINITTTDIFGLNYDNFRFAVPAPSALALFALGFAGLNARSSKR